MCGVRGGIDAEELTARLFEEFGILINNVSGKEGFRDQFVRFACRTTEDNADLIQALQVIAATVSSEKQYARHEPR